MSWWDRLLRWWRSMDRPPVAGPAALAEEDRQWLVAMAKALDDVARTENLDMPGSTSVTVVLSDELARSMAARLRAIAGAD